MVRHCAWVVNNFQVKGTGRTPYRSIRGKDYTGEVVQFGEICLGRNHSEDGAKLNMKWMRGVFVGKLDRTDELLLLTPTGAMKTRCVRRLEGDNAWNLQLLNLCVGSPWNATARSTQHTPTIQQKDELDSGRRAKRVYLRQNILDKYGRPAGCPGCLGTGQHTEECRARIEQEMVDKGDAMKIEAGGEIVARCKFERGNLVSQISIQAGRRAQRQTHPRENLSKDPVRMRVHWRVVPRQSTTFCVTCQLSTSAKIALH